jgi:CSLREA domain-containing protein
MRTAILLAFAGSLIALSPPDIHAQAGASGSRQITIDDPGDLPDFDTGDGACRICLAVNDEGECIQFGGCTFRAAIQQANTGIGAVAFTFAVAEIVPESDRLPDIFVPATVDGSVGTGRLRLNGAALAARGFSDPGISFESAHGSLVRDVEIFGFAQGIRFKNSNDVAVENVYIHDNTSYGLWFTGTGTGARVGGPSAVLGQSPGNHIAGNVNTAVRFDAGGNNIVEGNLLGTDAAGTAAQGNGSGILVNANSAPGTRIGGTDPMQRNVISGSANGAGIDVSGVTFGGGGGDAGGVTIHGNYIGTDVSGSVALGNRWGVALASSSGVTVGGDVPEEGNLISGNTTSGIFLSFAAVGNTVQGNTIGLNAAGDAALPNGTGAILQDSATDNLLLENTISGNTLHGVHIKPIVRTPSGNRLVGNAIGVSADGAAVFPNGGHGVLVENALNTQVGEEIGNVIAGNDSSGVAIRGALSTGTRVRRNTIGTNLDEAEGLGNAQEGIRIDRGASNNTIGGTEEGEGNRIAFNGSDGVWIVSGTGNRVLGNLIDDNGGRRIDLDDDGDPATRDGVTKNDDGDTDEGANNLQNFPTVTTRLEGGKTFVDGRLESTPTTLFRIELFARRLATDETLFLGAFEATTDAAGVLTFEDFAAGEEVRAVAATATDPDGNTSEYTAGGLIVNTTADTDDGACDHPLGSGGGNQDCTLREAISTANSESGPDRITFEIPASDPGFEEGIFWIRPQAALPVIVEALDIEGPEAPASGKADDDPILGLDGGDRTFDGLVFAAGGTGKRQQEGPCAVTRLIVGRFFNGLRLEGPPCDNLKVTGNLIGVRPNGVELNNEENGIEIVDARGVTVGGPAVEKGRRPGNVVAYNKRGVLVRGDRSDRTTVQGNLIFRNEDGVRLRETAGHLIGGSGINDGNVITGNFHEVSIFGDKSFGNFVQGNRIGTPLAVDGKIVFVSGNGVEIEGASDNVIGGETSEPGQPPGNIFFALEADTGVVHIVIKPASNGAIPSRNRIEGNLIGLENAQTPVKEALDAVGGIIIFNGEANVIGGRDPGRRNVISGLSTAIDITGPEARANIVQGNYIGTTPDGRAPHPNVLWGIRVSAGASGNVIGGTLESSGNVISGNQAFDILGSDFGVGISLYQAYRNRIQGNLIGLASDGVSPLGNKTGISLIESSQNLIGGSGLLERNRMAYNSMSGIELFSTSWNHFAYNEIVNNNVGVDADRAYYDLLLLNEIAFNHTGWLMSYSILIPAGNFFHDNGDNTGIHAFDSGGTIAGNTFEADLGDAIRLEEGSTPTIRQNNFADNAGFAVNNLFPSVPVTAGGNWWGDASGPSGSGPGGGQAVSEGVNFAGWRTEPVAYFGTVGLDTLFIPAGERDSVYAHVRNWTEAAETFDLTAENDDGWLEAPLDAIVEAGAVDGGSALFRIAVPASAGEGAVSEVRVNFAARTSPAVVDADTFLVFAYAPALWSVVVAPDTVRLRTGDVQLFAAGGRDQYSRPIAAAPTWTATGGTIDAGGVYTAGEIPGVYTVTATDNATGITGEAVVFIGLPVGNEPAETPLPNAFTLHQSYPNPFQRQARIPYDVHTPAHVTLEVFDLLGRRVTVLVDEVQPAGRYEALFDAESLPSGLYLYGIRMGNYRAFRRMVFVR